MLPATWQRCRRRLRSKVPKLDCYEAFCDYEVLETGEKGTGTSEYSVLPPWPQWLV